MLQLPAPTMWRKVADDKLDTTTGNSHGSRTGSQCGVVKSLLIQQMTRSRHGGIVYCLYTPQERGLSQTYFPPAPSRLQDSVAGSRPSQLSPDLGNLMQLGSLCRVDPTPHATAQLPNRLNNLPPCPPLGQRLRVNSFFTESVCNCIFFLSTCVIFPLYYRGVYKKNCRVV